MPRLPDFVFAVIGHNEVEYLDQAFQMLEEATLVAGERVFVDSGSTDGSAEVASDAGIETITAPLGKGRAVATLVEKFRGQRICLIDADIVGYQSNFVDLLCGEASRNPEAMIVGRYWSGKPRLMPSTDGVFTPMIEALFPEIGDRFGDKPLSGFRVLPRVLPELDLPPGFGVESFFNVELSVRGIPSRVVDIGPYVGRFRAKPDMPVEIGMTILDLADRHGRLRPGVRQKWEIWLEHLAGPLRSHEGTAEELAGVRSHLLRHLAKPRPPGFDL